MTNPYGIGVANLVQHDQALLNELHSWRLNYTIWSSLARQNHLGKPTTWRSRLYDAWDVFLGRKEVI